MGIEALIKEVQEIKWLIDEGPAHVKLTEAQTRLTDLKAALATIDPEAIRPSEDTEKLYHQIYDVLPISPALKLLDDGKLYALITAHDEAIRRECARAARNAIFDFGIGDKASNYYSPMIRKELAVQLAERAILGAEPEKDKHGCLSCGRQCPNDCPQDGKA